MAEQSGTRHTAGELTALPVADIDFSHDVYIGNLPVASVYNGNGPANAARIALTWNCHDELVAACQAVVDACTSAPPMDLIKRLGECADKCAAALAKASA